MSHLINIAIGSTTSLPGKIDHNLGQIAEFARRASGDGAHLLLTPEMSASGYGTQPEILAASEIAGDGPIYENLAQIARETGVVICAGFAERAGDKKYIAHYAIFPNGNFVAQRKHHTTPAEHLQFSTAFPTDNDNNDNTRSRFAFQNFDINGVRCAISICADMGTENLGGILDEQGVQVLLAPAGAGGMREDRLTTQDLATEAGREKYYEILQTVFMPSRVLIDCIHHQRALAAVNLCGYDGYKYYHVGHGTIINPMGEVTGFFHGLPNLDRQRPMYAHAIIDLDENVGNLQKQAIIY